MSGATPTTRRLPIDVAVIVLASIGTLAVAQAPHFRAGFAWVFFLAAGLRVLAGRDGRRFLPTRILQALGFSLAAMSLAYVLHRLSAPTHVDGPNALWALMEITCLFEALVLLWRQRAFSSFLVILFSSVHATGIAFAVPEESGLVFVGAYVVALAWALVVFERGAALEIQPEEDGAVAHVRARTPELLPWGTALRTTGLLLLFGLPLGAVLYVAAPRNWELPGNLGAAASNVPLDHDASLSMTEDDGAASSSSFVIGTTGPGGGKVPLGSVAEIKRNLEPWFEVSLADGSGLPPTVILRDDVQDRYETQGLWSETLTDEATTRVHRDYDDDLPDGWIPLEFNGAPGKRVTLRIRQLKGGNRRLYLQPNEVAVKLMRDREIVASAVAEGGDESLAVRRELKAGDEILQRYVAQPRGMDARLFGRLSNSAVAPQVSYLQVPAEVHGPLVEHARRVVGDETDPYRRALLLEGWLSSDAFTYTLKVPQLDRANPIVDFLGRTRSGHCEPFAYAMTLMLRCLGHPARFVRGFWGGDVLHERKSVILRGSHYHAWTELYLQGVGWVPLNPTPPERVAADAGSITAAEDGPGVMEEDWSFDFLGLDGEGWSAFWARVGRWIDRWILEPVGTLFTVRGLYLGWVLLLFLLLAVRGQREVLRLRRMVVAPGRKLPAGAYGRALMLLARKGVRRPAAWTPAEFARFVAKRLPKAAAPFEALTRLHEATRYGERPPEADAGSRHLAQLRHALRARNAG